MDVIEIQRRVQNAWTRQRWDDWRRTCADRYRFHLTPTIELDLEQTLAWSRGWFAAFPDYREQITALYRSDDTAVAYEIVGAGTSSADLHLGGRKLIPHSPGATFEVRYMKVLVLDGDGRVLKDRQYLDTQTLQSQLTATHRA
ncbi:ester cyclase [Gordonia sp. DT30]|uniref:ester cyclase n=1 Tax=Gordonia sp. DT30 TaxID=3416546 RepID=UPI003CEAF603